MRVKDHHSQSKYGVRDIWEVRLDKAIIEKLRQLAQSRKTTMSWLVRYCTFRLVNKKIIHPQKLHDMADGIRAKRRPFRELGRFYVCFYGEDILLLKIVAQKYNLTVSMVIRIALERYLLSLEGEARVPWWRLFWYGLKFNKQVEFIRQRRHGSFVQEFLNCESYAPEDYWSIPEGILPAYLLWQP